MYSEATLHTESGRLIWDTNGYYAFGEDSWKDTIVETSIVYQGGEIGIIPRLDSSLTYVAFIVGNYPSETGTTTVATLFGQMKAETQSIGTRQLSTPLIEGRAYVLRSEIRRTNYRIYIDGDLIFNSEFNRLNNGKVALYGTADTECEWIEVRAAVPDAWISNVGNLSGVTYTLKEEENGDKYIFLSNPSSDTALTASQISTVDETGTQTLSFNYIGEGVATITLDDTESASLALPLVTEWTRIEVTVTSSRSNVVNATVQFAVAKGLELKVNDVQIESGKVATDHILNDELSGSTSREGSFITYPSKNNIVANEGTVSLWVKPNVTYDIDLNLAPALLEYGDEDGIIALHFEGGHLVFTYGQSELVSDTSLLTSLDKDQWYHIAASWNSNGCSLYINDTKKSVSGTFEMEGASEIIRLGHSDLGADVFNGVIDDLIIYSKVISDEEISAIYNAIDPVPDTQQMILRATLDHAIGSFDKSIIEMTPAPAYGSPVLVTKADGTPMRKVSFFDWYTGQYTTYSEEQFLYDGVADYLRVGFKEIDEDNFKVSVVDAEGVIVGSPYRVEGDKIYMTLSDEMKKSVRGQILIARYQPENAYTVDFNIGQPDSFRVSIGKHDGQPVEVEYEGNRYSNEKLATMVDLNPIMNPNHQGFLYITQTPQGVSTFRAKVSPQDLPADGVSEAIVVIEPLDQNGNFISYANLQVSALEGSVTENHDPGSLRIRETAGRYMFRYRAPMIRFADRNVVEVPDAINVIDTNSGMGIQIPLTLTLSEDYSNGDQARQTEEAEWDLICIYILKEVMNYYGKQSTLAPEGLRDLIDLNGDGFIDALDLGEIAKYKYTEYLYQKYLAMKEWHRTNT